MAIAKSTEQDFIVRWGRQWFRWRSAAPLPLLALVIFMRPDFVWQRNLWLLPLLGIALAEGLRLWSVGFAGSSTRTRGDSVPGLVTAGPYRLVRNPLYVANIIMYACVSALFGFTWLTLVVILYSCLEYSFIVAYEEELLKNTFGSAYENFLRAVPRWAPLFSPGISSSGHTFSLKKGLRSEKGTLLSISAILIIWILKTYSR